MTVLIGGGVLVAIAFLFWLFVVRPAKKMGEQ